MWVWFFITFFERTGVRLNCIRLLWNLCWIQILQAFLRCYPNRLWFQLIWMQIRSVSKLWRGKQKSRCNLKVAPAKLQNSMEFTLRWLNFCWLMNDSIRLIMIKWLTHINNILGVISIRFSENQFVIFFCRFCFHFWYPSANFMVSSIRSSPTCTWYNIKC